MRERIRLTSVFETGSGNMDNIPASVFSGRAVTMLSSFEHAKVEVTISSK